MLRKAIETNKNEKFKECFFDPEFTIKHVENKITILNNEIDFMRKQAFTEFGVDTTLLQAKIARRDSMLVRLECLKQIE